MTGDGKLEILRRVVAALRSRSGIGILNEADCYNDIPLSPGDETLVDHFLDVYVRRAARAVAHAIDSAPTDFTLTEAWEAILRHWCIEQVDYAFRSREERDVYELDVTSWVRLLAEAGAATSPTATPTDGICSCSICFAERGHGCSSRLRR